jgi:DNA-binding NarL/FixJ family response regulator
MGEWDCMTVAASEVTKSKIDVAIADLDRVGAEGIEVLAGDRLSGPPASVVAVTSSDKVDSARRALCAGARGVLLKDARPDDVVDAVRLVGAGMVALAPHLTAWLVDEVLLSGQTDHSPRTVLPEVATHDAELTPRQGEILALVASGLSNAEIADRLAVSMPTVKSHVSALLRAYSVRDRTQLALLGLQRRSA